MKDVCQLSHLQATSTNLEGQEGEREGEGERERERENVKILTGYFFVFLLTSESATVL